MRHAFGVRVQKVQRVLKVQRVVVSPSAMSIKAAFGGKSHTTRLRLSEMHLYSRSVSGNCSAQGRSPDGTMNPGAEGA